MIMMDRYDEYIGKTLDGRYQIIRKVGIGGMAVVFEAYDPIMKRNVAVKMLKEEFSHEEQSVKRFINESKAVAMLSHPNIVNIFDVSVKEDEKFIVMEMVDGISLKSYLKQVKKIPLTEALYYTEQILKGLEHAHSKGIIHRDIKPQNIMLLKNGQIKVADFGIAKLPDTKTLTETDKAIGTVYYVSPEQASGKTIDRRSDIYSLGVVIYEMVTGVLPFDGDSPLSIALKQVNETPTPPSEVFPEINETLEKIILRALEKNPADRFQNASEMLYHISMLRSNPDYIIKKEKKKTEKKKKSAEKIAKDKKSNRAMLPIVLGVIFGVAIVGVSSLAYVLTNNLGDNVKTIEVENFEGREYTPELIEEMKNKDYRVKIEYAFSKTVEEGHVISQDPEYGEQRRIISGSQPCEITLTVSGGEETIRLPDFTAMDYRIIQTELNDLGLTAIVRKESCTYLDRNLIISTDPKPNTLVEAGSSVTLIVSGG